MWLFRHWKWIDLPLAGAMCLLGFAILRLAYAVPHVAMFSAESQAAGLWRTGFWDPERFSGQARHYRWTNGAGLAQLPNPGGVLSLRLTLAGGPGSTAPARIRAGSQSIAIRIAPEPRLYQLLLPPQPSQRIALEIISTVLPEPGGWRLLGVVVGDIRLAGGGGVPSQLAPPLALVLASGYLLLRRAGLGAGASAGAIVSASGLICAWLVAGGWRYGWLTSGLLLAAIALGAGAVALAAFGGAIEPARAAGGPPPARRQSPALRRFRVLLTPWAAWVYAQRRAVAGITLLLLSFTIGCLLMFWGSSPDEGDNTAAALLIAQGQVLYRDIFSHHAPLPYYWLAALFAVFGPSMLVARLSVAALHLMAFALILKITRLYLAIGLTACAWSLVGHFYDANMAIYDVYSALAILIVFVITFALLSGSIVASTSHFLIIGMCVGIAVLADPLAICALGIAILALLAFGVGYKRAALVAASACVLPAVFAAYLAYTGALAPFYQDMLVFNSTIYSKYTDTSLLRVSFAIRQAASLLSIGDPRWTHSNPFAPIVDGIYTFDRWLFTGFFYRLAVISISAVLLARRQVLLAVFVYCYAAMLLIRVEEFLHANAFVLIALLCAALLVVGQSGQRPLGRSAAGRRAMSPLSLHHQRGAAQTAAARAMWSRCWLGRLCSLGAASRIVLGCMLGWTVLRCAGFAIGQHRSLGYDANFAKYEQIASAVRGMSCGLSVELAYYPGDPNVLFFSELRPVSKYLFLYPWVAEIAVPEVKRSLSTGASIAFLDTRGEILQRRNQDYLREIKLFLDTNYVAIGRQYYVSPGIFGACFRHQVTRTTLWEREGGQASARNFS
jgi:hypothetical protein